MTSQSGSTMNEEEESVSIEQIEQLCNRLSKYDPCFRRSMIQYHLKKLGIPCNDERLVKLISLSYETMIRSILADCAQINHEKSNPSKTLTSNLLTRTLLKNNNHSDDNNDEQSNQIESESQMNTMDTFDDNDLFKF